MSAAAAEQRDEQLAEMLVDLAEGGEQTLAALLVELRDALAQPGDRGSEVGALGVEPGDALLELGRLGLGDEIDRPAAVAPAPQPLEPRLGLAGRRHLVIGGHAAGLQDRLGGAVQPLGDPADQLVAHLPGLLDRRLAAHAFLARGAERRLRLLQCLLGLGQRRLAACQRVAGERAFVGGGRDRLDQALALRRDLRRQPRQPLDLGGQRRVALRQRRDLAGGAFDAILPRALLEYQAGKPLAPPGGLAQQAVVLALRGELDRAPLAERRALARQRIAAAGRVCEFGEAAARRLALRQGLAAVGGEAFLALGQGGETRLHRRLALDQRVVLVARAAEGAKRLAHGLARRRLRRRRGGGLRHRRVERLLQLADRLFGGADLACEFGEAVALPQTLRRARRRAGGNGETVPAPERAVARDQALSRQEAGCQRRRFARIGNHGDLGKAAGERGRCGDMLGEAVRPCRKRRHRIIGRQFTPMARRRRIERGREIIAERGGQRRLIAGGDLERGEERRALAPRAGGKPLLQRPDLAPHPGASRLPPPE